MKIESRQLIETLGIFGVIASLIFVGMQLLLDRRIAIANQYQARAEFRLQRAHLEFENRDFLEVEAARWEVQRPGWWDDEVEAMYKESNEPMINFVRDSRGLQMFSIVMDNNYYQYSQGLMDEENWLALRQILKSSIQGDSLSRAFLTNRSLYNLMNLRIAVQELVEEIESEN